MDSLFLIFGWPGPIGVGNFLLCLGGMIYLLTLADVKNKEKRRIDFIIPQSATKFLDKKADTE